MTSFVSSARRLLTKYYAEGSASGNFTRMGY